LDSPSSPVRPITQRITLSPERTISPTNNNVTEFSFNGQEIETKSPARNKSPTLTSFSNVMDRTSPKDKTSCNQRELDDLEREQEAIDKKAEEPVGDQEEAFQEITAASRISHLDDHGHQESTAGQSIFLGFNLPAGSSSAISNSLSGGVFVHVPSASSTSKMDVDPSESDPLPLFALPVSIPTRKRPVLEICSEMPNEKSQRLSTEFEARPNVVNKDAIVTEEVRKRVAEEMEPGVVVGKAMVKKSPAVNILFKFPRIFSNFFNFRSISRDQMGFLHLKTPYLKRQSQQSRMEYK
jgi:hypothetical protein